MKKLISILLAVLIITLFSATALADDGADTITVTIDDIKTVAEQINEYDEELDMLAKLVYREARGVKSKMEQAAVIWCVLNRVDSGRYDSISDATTARSQFAWNPRTPINEDLRELAQDVVTRWLLEQCGVSDVGRVLPKEYLFFAGRNGRNRFRIGYRTRGYWDWSLPNPYGAESDER